MLLLCLFKNEPPQLQINEVHPAGAISPGGSKLVYVIIRKTQTRCVYPLELVVTSTGFFTHLLISSVYVTNVGSAVISPIPYEIEINRTR